MHGHGAHDDASYIPAELLEDWRRRDPIERLAERFDADEYAAIEFANQSPEPSLDTLEDDVYA
jgi:pyruvate dehydrogenase E1 component alpha subunit